MDSLSWLPSYLAHIQVDVEFAVVGNLMYFVIIDVDCGGSPW